MSSKRSENKKAWAKSRKTAGQAAASEERRRSHRPAPGHSAGALEHVRRPPSELDQISVLIVEEELGLPVTDMNGLRAMACSLPFEPCMSLLSILAGRVEATIRDAQGQIDLAREVFGAGDLLERYMALADPEGRRRIFGPQSLYTLMRVLIDAAYDAPIDRQMKGHERELLLRSVVASNSVIEREIDTSVGPTIEDLLAYELQAGAYYSRPQWMEEMSRHWDLYGLATEDPALAGANDFVPVAEWIGRSGLTGLEQCQLGWGLSAATNAFDATRHPHVAPAALADVLDRGGFAGRKQQALAVISADRAELQAAFAELAADDERYVWELRPFKTWPFLRLGDNRGLLLLGRPWIVQWMAEGLYYRAMLVAQAEDATPGGRTDHVQRYTAFAGQAFEAYCLRLAQQYVPAPAIVLGEQSYGKGGGRRTSDVAVVIGEDLILLEANARRVAAEPLVTGDPQDATNELAKLLIKKVNQLGVSVGALLAGEATLPGVDMTRIKRIFPVVIAAGNLWYTSHLWQYIQAARDDDKCAPLDDARVQPLQVANAAEYEMLIGLARDGHSLGEIFAHKTDGVWSHRDWAVWLREDRRAPAQPRRLPAIEATFKALTDSAQKKWFPDGAPADASPAS